MLSRISHRLVALRRLLGGVTAVTLSQKSNRSCSSVARVRFEGAERSGGVVADRTADV